MASAGRRTHVFSFQLIGWPGLSIVRQTDATRRDGRKEGRGGAAGRQAGDNVPTSPARTLQGGIGVGLRGTHELYTGTRFVCWARHSFLVGLNVGPFPFPPSLQDRHSLGARPTDRDRQLDCLLDELIISERPKAPCVHLVRRPKLLLNAPSPFF